VTCHMRSGEGEEEEEEEEEGGTRSKRGIGAINVGRWLRSLTFHCPRARVLACMR
jgi:hypothetical protein